MLDSLSEKTLSLEEAMDLSRDRNEMNEWYVCRWQDTNIQLATCLEPPTGFSDGHELSEAECDMDTICRLKRSFKACENSHQSCGEQEYSHKNFTIAVWQQKTLSTWFLQVYEAKLKLLKDCKVPYPTHAEGL
jgi:hypothetical protein